MTDPREPTVSEQLEALAAERCQHWPPPCNCDWCDIPDLATRVRALEEERDDLKTVCKGLNAGWTDFSLKISDSLTTVQAERDALRESEARLRGAVEAVRGRCAEPPEAGGHDPDLDGGITFERAAMSYLIDGPAALDATPTSEQTGGGE